MGQISVKGEKGEGQWGGVGVKNEEKDAFDGEPPFLEQSRAFC